MKSNIMMVGVLLFSLLIAGCGTSKQDELAYQQTATGIALVVESQLTAAAPAVTATSAPVVVEKQKITAGELSVGTQLLVGIVKLEGTEFAITREQAMAFTPLWTNLQTLLAQQTPSKMGGGPGEQQTTQATPSAENTDSQKQVTEILQGIQDVLTAEQVNQIVSLNLTQNDVTALMEANQISTATPSAQQGGGGMGGGMGGGTPPDGGGGSGAPSGDMSGGGPSGGGGTPPDMNSTPQAGQQMGQGERIQTELLEFLLKFLQTRAQ